MKRILSWLLALAVAAAPFDSLAIRGVTSSGSTTTASIATAESGEDSLTAFATGGQTSATALSATVTNHRVSTVATAGDSVKLPAATVGLRHYVRNDGVAAMQVFGQSTETINGVASATGISQAPGMGVWYICTTAGAWTTSPVSTITATTKMLIPDGSASVPSLGLASDDDGSGTGFFRQAANTIGVAFNGTERFRFSGNSLQTSLAIVLSPLGSVDNVINYVAANCILYSASTGTATGRTECNKSVTGIANAVATDVLTVTIPNAAHSASLRTRITCSLGAGGAIGANEATATNTYMTVITRTAGVATVVAISSASDAAASAVAGAATVTATLANTAMTGAVGATQTFTQQATVSRSGGSSTNHTCLVHAQLMNANATGVTIQ